MYMSNQAAPASATWSFGVWNQTANDYVRATGAVVKFHTSEEAARYLVALNLNRWSYVCHVTPEVR